MNMKDTLSGNIMIHSCILDKIEKVHEPKNVLSEAHEKVIAGIVNDSWLSENELQSTHASEHPGFKRSDKELAADIRLALERAFKAGRESK